jgi:hypothetical protein
MFQPIILAVIKQYYKNMKGKTDNNKEYCKNIKGKTDNSFFTIVETLLFLKSFNL